MSMEAPEDVMGSNSNSSSSAGGGRDCPPNPTTVLKKRKRTKRQRAAASLPNIPTSSSTSSLDFSSATEEEEDMAHCLILLAQGHNRSPLAGGGGNGGGGGNMEKFVSRKFTETTTTAGGKAGFYVYECKTCNKCFPSFQALGGHRASHKKPKLSIQLFPTDDPKQIDHGLGITDGVIAADASSLAGNQNKLRVHGCSICRAEFLSGQALGGHMRRHRPIVPSPPELQEGIKKERNNDLLSLDLNLPAPTDEPTVAFLPTICDVSACRLPLLTVDVGQF